MRGFNNFGRLAAQIHRGGVPIVKKGAFDIEANAKSFVRVDTSDLKNSIEAQPTDNPLVWIVGTNVEYAVHQEYGPVEDNPRPWSYTPFMRPARERVRGPYIEAWRKFVGGLR